MFKIIYRIGFIGYLFLFILSAVFYKERTVFTDIAYHLFYLLKDGTFAIQNFRYGAAFTQIFPLAASWLSLPLSTVMFFYSVGFTIFYFTCYVVAGSVFKNHKLALILLLFNFLFVTDTFYWIQSELPQGIAFSILFFSFLSTRQESVNAIPLAMIFFAIVTIVFFPPATIIGILFHLLILLFYLGYNDRTKIIAVEYGFLPRYLFLKKVCIQNRV